MSHQVWVMFHKHKNYKKKWWNDRFKFKFKTWKKKNQDNNTKTKVKNTKCVKLKYKQIFNMMK